MAYIAMTHVVIEAEVGKIAVQLGLYNYGLYNYGLCGSGLCRYGPVLAAAELKVGNITIQLWPV